MASEVDKGFDKVLSTWGRLIIRALKREVQEDDSIASRDLLQSIGFDPIREGDNQIAIRMAEHWKFVDKGRKPGKRPPMQPIQEWIARKGIPLKGRGAKKNQARTLAFFIARKIGREGTRPTNFVEHALTQKFKNDMKRSISKHLGKNIKLAITT